MERIVIVGAALAGQRTLQALRRGGHEGEVVLVGGEPHLPYDRPPLSKQFLAGEWDRARLDLGRSGAYDDVDVRLGATATALDVDAATVVLADGSTVAGDHVVIATGARARRLPGQPALDGLCTLRTVDDAEALRDHLDRAERLVVVGAGFIGAEVASTARSLGVDVTVLEADEAPLSRGLGPVVGRAIGRLQEPAGVDLRLGVLVDHVTGEDGRVAGVALADDTHLAADVVLVGIGAVPVTDWLDDSGLDVADGVAADAGGRAVSGGGRIWAVGDVAAWEHPRYGRHRTEHWTSAMEQAGVVAANILGDDRVLDQVPFVWSDQFGHKVQVVGAPAPDDEIHPLVGDLEDDLAGWVVAHVRDGTVTAVTGIDQPRVVAGSRRLLADDITLEDLRATMADAS